MIEYPSNIVFMYYEDYMYGVHFVRDVLELNCVMEQDFAQVFQVSSTSYLGVVDASGKNQVSGDTLVSFNTSYVENEYERISKKDVCQLTHINFIPEIPLKSFFFEDKEGHRFEIQQFTKDEDLKQFN